MKLIDADDVMERIEQAYEDMGVDTHGVWNKQLAEIFKAEETDVEDIRQCLSQILGAVAQAPTIDRPQGEWVDAEIPLESGDTMPIQACNLCKTFYPLAYTGGGHRFCPNCGARMKGADDGSR